MNRASRWSGFTLIELVIVIVVMSILAAVTVPLLTSGLNAYDMNHSNLVTMSKLRYATERMAREIREVRYNASAYSISNMGANSITFTKNDAASTVVTINGTGPGNVTLSYSTPALSGTLTDQLSSLAFAYYQADGTTVTASNANVAYVEATLTLNDPNSGAYAQRTRIALRNR